MKWGYTIKKLLIIIIMLLISTAILTGNEVIVTFHNFPWGTSMETFTARVGNPAHVEEYNGIRSLVYDNISMAGFSAFMVVYFSQNGLEGGAYYFDTIGLEELMMCYMAVQRELVAQFNHPPPAPEGRFEELLPEMRVYESAWILPTGYIHLKVNTRTSDPVTLWISFPTLTAMLDGG
jgi:hypothetical protein